MNFGPAESAFSIGSIRRCERRWGRLGEAVFLRNRGIGAGDQQRDCDNLGHSTVHEFLVGTFGCDQLFASADQMYWCSVHTGCFNAAVSIGSFRKRLPVAAKIALVTAGTTAEVPASPIPPGDSGLWTIWTSTIGASLMRRIW